MQTSSATKSISLDHQSVSNLQTLTDGVSLFDAPSALKIKGLSKKFSNSEHTLFENISFDIKAGESVSLIGPNGAGKSTLLRCCLRLIEPDTGNINLHGVEITNLKAKQLRHVRKCVGFVFQKHHLVPRLSVLSNVLHGYLSKSHGPRKWFHAIAPKEVREQAFYNLEQVGLAHLATKRCDQLSGGQSQRIAIARALMQEPQLLIADEPTASLDPKAGNEVMELFVKLSEEMDLALVFVSHDLEQAVKFSDRIICLKDKNIVLDDNSENHSVRSLERIFHDD